MHWCLGTNLHQVGKNRKNFTAQLIPGIEYIFEEALVDVLFMITPYTYTHTRAQTSTNTSKCTRYIHTQMQILYLLWENNRAIFLTRKAVCKIHSIKKHNWTSTHKHTQVVNHNIQRSNWNRALGLVLISGEYWVYFY